MEKIKALIEEVFIDRQVIPMGMTSCHLKFYLLV